MFGIVQRRLRTIAEFEEAWSTPLDVPKFVRDLGEPGSLSTESGYQAAAHFIGGSLESSEFKLFRNGGLPLLERRTPPLREEILLKLGPNAVRGAYLPISLELRVSHEGLREVRERYWLGAGRPSVVLVQGNIGLVQQVPTLDIWNVATEDALPELVYNIRQEVLPFLEMLYSPNMLRRAIFDFEAPLFDHATSIEWFLIEFGKKEARDYVRALIDNEDIVVQDFWSHHDAVKSELGAAIKTGETARNLAMIAVSHDLYRLWLY